MSSFNPSAVASASNLSNPSSFAPTPSPSASFNADGFYISPTPLLTPSETTSLRTSLESLIRHSYPSSTPPTKPCKKINAPPDPEKPLGFAGNLQNTKTLQIVNTHLSDPSISSILRSPTLASYIGHLTNWPSVRYIQDQAWLKPPNAPSLSFHRDRPYIPLKRELTENDLDGGYHKNVRIVTLWITLDDIEEDSGGLEFAVGSHTWLKTSEEGYPVGANSSFFGGEDYRYMASKMGKDEGVEVVEFKETVGLKAGDGSFHDGDMYHGSGVNRSKTLPRRGIGIHFSRGDVEWDVEKARGSKVWKEFVEGVEEGGEAKLSEEDFPIVWTRKTEGEWEEEIKSEKPSIKTALKNLMTNRIAQEGPAIEKLRLMQTAAKFVITTVNTGIFVWPANSPPINDEEEKAEVCYKLYDKIKSITNAKVSELMSSTFLKLSPIKKSLYDYKSKGVKSLSDDEVYYVKGFIEEFLETVESGEELVWTEDLEKVIRKRGKERVERAAGKM